MPRKSEMSKYDPDAFLAAQAQKQSAKVPDGEKRIMDGPATIAVGKLDPEGAGPKRQLCADGKTPFASRTVRIDQVPIADIEILVENHRLAECHDQAKLQGLADSMAKDGQLQPIRVREGLLGVTGLPLSPPGKLVMEFGFRRLAAAKLLGWSHIEAKVLPASEKAAILEAQGAENLHRENINALEEANLVGQWLELMIGIKPERFSDPSTDKKALGEGIKKVAEIFGKSPDWVRDRIALLGLHKKARELLLAGRLTLKAAYLLGQVGDPVRQGYIADDAARDEDGAGGCSLSVIAMRIRNSLRTLHGIPWRLEVAFAGKPACSTCQFNSLNQGTLFGHDKLSVVSTVDTAFCSYGGCYETKQRKAEADKAKAIAEATKHKAAATETGVAPVLSKFTHLKPSGVVREMKRQEEDSGRVAKKAAKDLPYDKQPEYLLQDAERKRNLKINDMLNKSAASDPLRLKAARLIGALDISGISRWGGKFTDKTKADLDMLKNTNQADVDRLGRRVLDKIYSDTRGLELICQCSDEVEGYLATLWNLQFPPRPVLEDFMPKAQEPKAKGKK